MRSRRGGGVSLDGMGEGKLTLLDATSLCESEGEERKKRIRKQKKNCFEKSIWCVNLGPKRGG